MKLLSTAERAIIWKDVKEMWGTKLVRTTLVMVPLLLAVIMPLFYIGIICLVPLDSLDSTESILALFSSDVEGYTPRQTMFYMMNMMLSPMLFTMVPLMASTTSASFSFAGEKERGTLETLFFSPLTLKQLFKAKVLSCMVFSLTLTLGAFAGLAVVLTAGGIYLGMPWFFNGSWFVLLFCFAPAITLLAVEIIVFISGKSKTYMEASQTAAFLVFPVIAIFLGQFTGLFRVSPWVLLLASVLIAGAAFLLWSAAVARFTPEKLMAK